MHTVKYFTFKNQQVRYIVIENCIWLMQYDLVKIEGTSLPRFVKQADSSRRKSVKLPKSPGPVIIWNIQDIIEATSSSTFIHDSSLRRELCQFQREHQSTTVILDATRDFQTNSRNIVRNVHNSPPRDHSTPSNPTKIETTGVGDLATTAEIVPFNFKSYEVRSMIIDDEPWFVAKDVCDALGLKSQTSLVNMRPHQKGIQKMLTLGGPQKLSIVNESGLYALIFKCQKKQAHDFQDWVTSEVLPAIRKTGTYTAPESYENTTQAVIKQPVLPDLTTEAIEKLENAQRTLRVLKDNAEFNGLSGTAAIHSAYQTLKQLTGIDFAELIGATHLIADSQEQLYTPTELGYKLGCSAQAVNIILCERHLQYKEALSSVQSTYAPTETGKQHSVFLDTTRRFNDGAMIRQLKWKASVLEILKQASLTIADEPTQRKQRQTMTPRELRLKDTTPIRRIKPNALRIR